LAEQRPEKWSRKARWSRQKLVNYDGILLVMAAAGEFCPPSSKKDVSFFGESAKLVQTV
jgi:hypothetical protein